MASTEVLIGVVVGTIVGVILSVLIIVFLLFWLGFCHCPGGDDDLRDDDDSRDENRRNNSDAAARQRQQRQYKGIPLNTVVRPLSAAEQEERDRVIARYKRRKAREERRAAREQRRQARAAARAAAAAANGAAVVAGVEGEGKAMNVEGQALHRALPAGREGSNGADVTPNINTTTIAMHGEGVEGGGAAGLTRRSSFASTMNTLTTTTATTALTSSAVAYGRGEYLPYDGDEYDEEENDHNSYYNNNSERRRRRRSTSHRGNAAGEHSGKGSETEMVPVSAAASSCGRHSSLSRHTLATLRGYVRELGRQRRLRRKGRRRHGAGDGDGEVDILNQWETSLGRSSSSSSSLTSSSSSSSGGGSVGRRSVASSMPRPPEEILGRNAFTARYSGITGMTSQPAQDHTTSPAPHTVSHNSQGCSEPQQYTAPTTTTGGQKADNNKLMKTSHANVGTAAALHSTSTPASREPTHDSEAEELAGAVSQREHHPHTTHTATVQQHQQQAAAVVVVGPQSQPREAEHMYYNAHTQLSLVQQLPGRPLQSLGQPGKAQPTAVDTAPTAVAAVTGGQQYVDAHHIDLTQSSAFGQHAMSEEERDAEGNVGGMTHGQLASHPYTNTNNNTNKSNAKGNDKDDDGSSSDSSSILVLGHRASTAQGTTNTTTGGRYGDEPHTSSHAATTTTNNHNNNNATVDVRRRKWTGRDVEQNVALSGFFAAPMQNSLELQPRPRRSSVLHNTPDLTNTIGTTTRAADAMQTAVAGVTQRRAEEPASPVAAVRGGTDDVVDTAAAATGEAKKAAESK